MITNRKYLFEMFIFAEIVWQGYEKMFLAVDELRNDAEHVDVAIITVSF